MAFQTIPYPGFIGPAATLQSLNVNAEDTINWFLEVASPGTPKSPAWLVPTPGLRHFVVLSQGPVRAIFYQDGRGFAMGGAGFSEFTATHTNAQVGTFPADNNPGTISSNGTIGNQLFIVSSGNGYIYDLVANTFTQITVGFPSPVVMGGFVDDYFVVLKGQSRQFYLSALADGTSWDPLDVGEVSQSSDNLRAMVIAHRELVLFGSKTTEFWADIGDPDFPFAPIPGTLLQQGIAAPWSAQVLDNTVFWLSENENGDRVVYSCSDYTATRISTHAIEWYLSTAPRIDDAIAWTYQQRGHTFYVLVVPSLDTSLVYDRTTGLWHKRALWDDVAMRWQPILPRCHTFGFGQHLVGDRLSSAVYVLDPDTYTDGQILPG